MINKGNNVISKFEVTQTAHSHLHVSTQIHPYANIHMHTQTCTYMHTDVQFPHTHTVHTQKCSHMYLYI